MKLIEKRGPVEIWLSIHTAELYVYGVTASGDPRIAPSLGMAREIAAGGER
jgi:hypothetical protein